MAKILNASFTQLCSACEAGDCSVGLWSPWTLWGLRLSCDWVEWDWRQECLCWHPLAPDGWKSQTSSCLLAPVKSNCSLWKLCLVNCCLFLVRFTWFCVLLSAFSWHGTLGKHTALMLNHLRQCSYLIFEAVLDHYARPTLISFTSSESVLSLW